MLELGPEFGRLIWVWTVFNALFFPRAYFLWGVLDVFFSFDILSC